MWVDWYFGYSSIRKDNKFRFDEDGFLNDVIFKFSYLEWVDMIRDGKGIFYIEVLFVWDMDKSREGILGI